MILILNGYDHINFTIQNSKIIRTKVRIDLLKLIIKRLNKDNRQSSGSGESNDFCVLSETFSAEEEVVFSDKAHLAFAVSALSAVLSEFSCVSSPEQVWHSYYVW